MNEAIVNRELVWVVYGQDFVYGRDTHVLGIFANEGKAGAFAARMSSADPRFNYVAEPWAVVP